MATMTKAKRSAAAKKAARTRARNKKKRSEAAKRAAKARGHVRRSVRLRRRRAWAGVPPGAQPCGECGGSGCDDCGGEGYVLD